MRVFSFFSAGRECATYSTSGRCSLCQQVVPQKFVFASTLIGSRESLVQVIDGWRNVNDSKTKEGLKKGES